jgi:N12 class adenine-specific DNA methylase
VPEQDDLATDLASVRTPAAPADDLASDLASVRTPAPDLSAHGITDPASVKVTNPLPAPGRVNPKTGSPVVDIPYGQGILDLPIAEGLQRAARAAKVVLPAVAGYTDPGREAGLDAAHQLVTGVFQAASPAIVGLTVANPVEGGWALLRAYLAQKVGEKGADALGADPQVKALAGDVGAVVSGALSAEDLLTGTQRAGRVLTLAAKLSGSGYGPTDIGVPGMRGTPVYEEPMVDRAAREARQARTAAVNQEAAQIAAEQPPPPPRGPQAPLPPEPAQPPIAYVRPAPTPAPPVEHTASGPVVTLPPGHVPQEAQPAAPMLHVVTPEQGHQTAPLEQVRQELATDLASAREPEAAPSLESDLSDVRAEAEAEPVAAIAAAREQVDTEPTDAQKEAGNYQKGHVTLHGLDITLENPVGSTRSGTAKDGTPWEVTMPADYGYIKRTEGADGDHVDVYLGPNPASEKAFIVYQKDPETHKFDEHKVILGVDDGIEAQKLYRAGFSDGKGARRLMRIVQTDVAGLKQWLQGDLMASPPPPAGPREDEANPRRVNAPVVTSEPAEAQQPEHTPSFTFPTGTHQEVYQAFKRALTWAVNAKDWKRVIHEADRFNAYYTQPGAPPFPDYWANWERAKEDAERALQREADTSFRPGRTLVSPQTSTAAAQPVENPADLSNNRLALEIAAIQNKPGRTPGLSVDGDPVYTDAERARYQALQQERADRNRPKPVTPQIVPATMPEEGVESTYGEPTVRGDAGQRAQRGTGAPEPAGAPSEGALEAVPPADDTGARAAGNTRPDDQERVPPQRVREPDRNGPEPGPVPAGSAVDLPVPVSVSPSGATHDPGVAPLDYDLTPERIAAIIQRGGVARAKGNLAAIALVKTLQSEDRYATAEEQAVLAGYVGWGDAQVAQYLASYPKHDWSGNERAMWEQIQKLPEEERKALAGSTLNAHFTFELYRPIWEALERAGFGGGKVLEPSVGTGHAFGFMPAAIRAQSTLSAAELEPLTAAIAGYLYPSATVQAVGYEHALIAKNTQDLAIGNPPFGNYGVDDPLLPEYVRSSIHNYFFAKALDHVRPGGLIAFITSRYTLDGVEATRARQYLTERADFLGAVRLPNTAFDKSAKTEVVTDLIFLRKRAEGQAPSAQNRLFETAEEHPDFPPAVNWKGKPVGNKVYRSSWYGAHPEYILGTESREGTMRAGGEYTVSAPREGVLDALAHALAQLLPPGTYTRATRASTAAPPVKQAEGAYKVGEYRIGEKPGTIEMVERDGTIVVVPTEKGTAARLTGLIGIRDALRATTGAMLDPTSSDAAIKGAQRKLLKLYNAYTGRKADGSYPEKGTYGPLNSPYNKRLFAADPEATNLLALEQLKSQAQLVTRKDGTQVLSAKYVVVGLSDIFTKRALHPPKTVDKVDTPQDALLASLGTSAGIDWPYMSRISGTSTTALQAALTADGLVFEQPDGSFVLAEEYLSGDVVTKLEDAKAAGKRFARNVTALQAIQPVAKTREDILSGDVAINLGAGWVDPEDYEAFAEQQLNAKGSIVLKQIAATTLVRWSLHADTRAEYTSKQHPLAVKYEGGTYGFLDMLDDALNLKMPALGHYEGSGKERRWVPEPVPTLAARANVDALRDLWRQYVFEQDGVQDRALHIYNTRYNRTVERHFDGSHLTLPGMATLYDKNNQPLTLHPHQVNGIWRILSSGNTLLAHEVGAGKTFEMIAAAMEMRRTGRAVKPMIVVPTYLLGQWRADILRLYPNARVAAFDEKDLEAKKRQTAMARIAYNDWDIVLVPHSSFGLLPVSEERLIGMMQRWIDELKSIEGEVDANDVKGVERQRKRLEDKVRKLRDKLLARTTDNALTWEQLGVDALIIDEAHAFKNLFFYSKLENLRGLSRSEADRSLDLFVKVQAINEQSHYRNLVLATATPLMNSMAEVYTMQRYLQPQTLRRAGFENFDSWYAMFAHAYPGTEQQPDGTYKEIYRLRDFSNLKLLARMVREVMDYVGWEDMPYLKLPKIKGGKIEIVQTEPHPQYPLIQEWFAKRMQNIRDTPPHYDYRKDEYIAPSRPDPFTGQPMGDKVDNILTIMNDAKKAAIDLRLVVGDRVTDYKGSRLQTAADKMAAIYRAERPKKGVQLVFLDMGTPKNPGPLEFLKGVEITDETGGELKDEEDVVDEEGEDTGYLPDDDSAFNLYDALKAALIKRGVPSREIAYIHQANSAAERLALFEAAQRGDVRFVLASTDKGGVGMNIQERLAAIHELDAPRAGRPGDLRQRMGRGIRQGNSYPDVALVRYVTKGSTDEWLWGMLTTKDYQIRQFMKGDAVSMTDEDPSTMSLAEAQMRASGDPRTIELVDLKGKLARLDAQASAAERAQAQAKADLSRGTAVKAAHTRDLAELQAWVKAHWTSQRGKAFAMTIEGQTVTEQKKANEALIAAARDRFDSLGPVALPIGRIGGVDLLATAGMDIETNSQGVGHEVHLVRLFLDGAPFGSTNLLAVRMSALKLKGLGEGMNPVAAIVNEYESIPGLAKRHEQEIATQTDRVEAATRTLARPAPAIVEAQRARVRIGELETILKAEGEANEQRRKEQKQEEARQAEEQRQAATKKPEGGTTLQSTILPGAAEFGEYVLEPAAAKIANAVRHETGLILSVIAPAHVGVAPRAADTIAAHNAAHDQRIARVGRLLEDARRVMDGWSHERVRDFWDVMEGLQPVTALPRPDRQFVQLFRAVLDRWTTQLLDHDLLETYLEHYFPHEWKQGTVEGNAIRSLLGRRPIQGREAYRKRRSIPTMQQGLQAGLEPVSWNPAEQVLRKVVEMSRSLNAREMQKDLKRQGFLVFVRADKARPEAIRHYEQVPEAAMGTVYGPRVPEQTFGRVVAGHYYGPPEVVRLLKHYISPGLWGRSVLFDAYKTLGNETTSLLLGWSSFHLWLTGIEAMISKLALGVEEVARGEAKEAVKTFAQVGPHGVIRDLVRGYRAVQGFYTRDATANDTAGIIGQIVQGGGGFGWSLFEHEAAPKRFATDVRRLLGAVRQGALKDAAAAAGKAAVHAPFALAELPMGLIMDHWVPYLKASAFLDLAQMELRRLGPDATLEDQRKVYRKAWDAVDDRFGQLRYANLFWHNTFKQILTGGFLSVGWQVGSLRHGLGVAGQIPRAGKALRRVLEGGGTPPRPDLGTEGETSASPEPEGYQEPWLQRNAAWMLALLAVTVTADAVYQYLMTGKRLGEDKDGKTDWSLAMRDAVYPRTGVIGPSGREERRFLIGYLKDYVAWAKHPLRTAENKLKPALHMIADLLENEDYFGNAIWDSDEPMVQRLADGFLFALRSVEPIGLQNAKRIAGDHASATTLLKAYLENQVIPFQPASAEAERSAVEQYLHDLIPPSHRTKEEAQKAEARRDVRQQMREGDRAGALTTAKEGGLSGRSVQAITRSVRVGPLRSAFQSTTWPQAVKAMELATPDEQAVLKGPFLAKAARAIGQARTPADRAAILKQRNTILRVPVPTS